MTDGPDTDDLVWYVSYGSNLSEGRFLCYIEGGTPPGGSKELAGCRDKTPPRDNKPVTLPNPMYFAGQSTVWGGGGVGFVDHSRAEAGEQGALCRGWLVTREQFDDIVRQESSDSADGTIPDEAIHQPGVTRTGPGMYQMVLSFEGDDGYPVVTFTGHQTRHQAETGDPAAATTDGRHLHSSPPNGGYLWTISRGIKETFPDMTDDQVIDYLHARSGANGMGRDVVEYAVTTDHPDKAAYFEITGTPPPDSIPVEELKSVVADMRAAEEHDEFDNVAVSQVGALRSARPDLPAGDGTVVEHTRTTSSGRRVRVRAHRRCS